MLWDDNSISIDGPTSLCHLDGPAGAFRGRRLGRARRRRPRRRKPSRRRSRPRSVSDRPTLIACRTIIGKGAPNLQGSEKTHGAPLGDAEIAAARANIGWAHAPFEVPDEIRRAWRDVAARGAAARRAWEQRLAASPQRARVRGRDRRRPADAVFDALAGFRKEHFDEGDRRSPPARPRRWRSGAINAATDLTVGGSADLTHSNLTLTKDMGRIAPGDYAGRYIHYGIREHGMAAAMNGIALHGGFIPYGGTFLCFADYARGAIRLSALMGQRVIYVMTHDSIGLGEDGPTHQPIEHLAMLRATPNLDVFRPADIIETAECWELALRSTRPPERAGAVAPEPADAAARAHAPDNRSARGAYVLREAAGQRDVTLIATGSEVEIAVAAADLLPPSRARGGASSRCRAGSCSRQQDEAYRADVLGTRAARRRRGGGAPRLGPLDRRARRLHRHERLRRQRAGGRPLPPLRHHADAVADAALKLIAARTA